MSTALRRNKQPGEIDRGRLLGLPFPKTSVLLARQGSPVAHANGFGIGGKNAESCGAPTGIITTPGEKSDTGEKLIHKGAFEDRKSVSGSSVLPALKNLLSKLTRLALKGRVSASQLFLIDVQRTRL